MTWTHAVTGAALLGALLGSLIDHAVSQSATQDKGTAMSAYVGAFTTARRTARGAVIQVNRTTPATGASTHMPHIGDLTNPSFPVLSPDQRFLHSVHGDADYATASALERETGHAKVLNRAATGGNNGV